jgi:hypothetical protein
MSHNTCGTLTDDDNARFKAEKLSRDQHLLLQQPQHLLAFAVHTHVLAI